MLLRENTFLDSVNDERFPVHLEWISKAGLHWGSNSYFVQHCIMGAVWSLGTLQREHVHGAVWGHSVLCTETHELPRPLVKTNAIWWLKFWAWCDYCLFAATCSSTVFVHGGNCPWDGLTLERCTGMNCQGLWVDWHECAGFVRMMRISSAPLNRYEHILDLCPCVRNMC